MTLFAVVQETIHHVGDARCPACVDHFPEACPCGGLLHAEPGEPEGDATLEPAPVTRCDACGRSAEDLEEQR